jgi:hypothetical protein
VFRLQWSAPFRSWSRAHLSLSVPSGAAGALPVENVPAIAKARRGSGLRRWVTALACGAAMEGLMLGGPRAEAQTAHAGGTIPIGSGFHVPTGVAVDASGDVFVADYNNNAVKKIVAVNGVVSASSQVSTIGSGFSYPSGVAVDGSGNVFVADQNNNAVKEVDLSDPPALSFPTATSVGSTDSTDGPLTVTVANSGNAVLSFPIPETGNDPSISANFTLDSTSGDTCPLTTSTSGTPSTLAAGATCTLRVSFAPTTGGSISGSLVLTDTNLNANPGTTQTISLSGKAVLITLLPTTLPAEMEEAAYNQTLTATGGTAPYTFSVTSGMLPAGFTSSSSGLLSGTPASAGPFGFTITATDSNGFTGSTAYGLTLGQATATVTWAAPQPLRMARH